MNKRAVAFRRYGGNAQPMQALGKREAFKGMGIFKTILHGEFDFTNFTFEKLKAESEEIKTISGGHGTCVQGETVICETGEKKN